DPSILGKNIMLNANALTVIGITDASYGAGDMSAFYLPLALQPVLLNQGDWLRNAERNWLMVDARLRPGVSARQAQAEVDLLSSALRPTQSTNLADRGVIVSPGGVNPHKQRDLAALAFA